MFRPCIDLHEGKVKQIIGATLGLEGQPYTHFISPRPAAWYARLYKKDGLYGGHIIMLGPGNEVEAKSALAEFPRGLQIGGGIRPENALEWLSAGASHVIVTSYLFDEKGRFLMKRLEQMAKVVTPSRLVVDFSCKKIDNKYRVVARKWQQLTNLILSPSIFQELQNYCSEILIHAVDREGLQQGPDFELIKFLAEYSPIPVTYAGGVKSIDELEKITQISQNRVDVSIGSALDIFGGTGVKYKECVEFNRRLSQTYPTT